MLIGLVCAHPVGASFAAPELYIEGTARNLLPAAVPRVQRFAQEPSDSQVKIAETERLRIRWLHADDAAFIFELVNQPSWLRYIGDKGVKTLQDATRYIENGPAAMYRREGFGLYMVELRETSEPIGMCGLIKRDALTDVDLGFAFLPGFWRNGYALEAAIAVMRYARDALGLARIVAILSQDNDRSSRLLEKLGFCLEGTVRLQPDDEELKLYAIAA